LRHRTIVADALDATAIRHCHATFQPLVVGWQGRVEPVKWAVGHDVGGLAAA
jgi:hypothetical protein